MTHNKLVVVEDADYMNRMRKLWDATRLPRHRIMQLRKEIRSLKDKGLTNKQILAEITRLGFRTGDGKEFSTSHISYHLNYRGRRKRTQGQRAKRQRGGARKTPQSPAPQAASDLQLAILTEPGLSDKKKLELLAALLS